MKKNAESESCRFNRVGGEAVIEGVMMKAGETCCTACRDEKGQIHIEERKVVSIKKKHKFFALPLIRGVVGFIESMILSFSVLEVSAEVMGGDEMKKDNDKKFSIFDFVMVIAGILGVALALFLFLYLPSKLAEIVTKPFDGSIGSAALAAIEGALKIIIFILYIVIVSLMKDIRRVFEYHGAEHKSIACFESGTELTPENAKEYTRFHKRCGTSFMFVMIILGVLIGFAIHLVFPNFKGLPYAAVRLLLLPLVVGLGYEFIMYAGKHNNIITKILSAPGLWMQRITTREPDLKELEVAITALKFALPDIFPDFDRSAYPKINAKEESTEAAKSEENSGENQNASE